MCPAIIRGRWRTAIRGARCGRRSPGRSRRRCAGRPRSEGGFVGGPAVAADGTIYVTTALGDLLAFAPDGTQLWKATLSGGALSGGPALGADGTIYVTDGGGNLTAFYPEGKSCGVTTRRASRIAQFAVR